jgi:hypothetical protein
LEDGRGIDRNFGCETEVTPSAQNHENPAQGAGDTRELGVRMQTDSCLLACMPDPVQREKRVFVIRPLWNRYYPK